MGFEKDAFLEKDEADSAKGDEEEYRNIIKHAPIGVYEMDFYGTRFRRVNNRFCEVLGYSEEELLAMSPLDLLTDDGKKVMQDKIKEALTGKYRDEFFSSVEFEAKTKNGQRVWGLIHSKVKFKDGKPDTVLVFVQDITERKKAEEVLRQSEELYRTLCDNNEDGFILLEPLYDESCEACDFRFLKVNRAYECQTGRKVAVVEGKRAREVAPDLEPEWILLVGRVAKTGKAVRYENFNRRTNRWYDAHYFPFGKGQVGIIFRDITERKKAEEILDKKQQELNLILDSSPTIIFHKDKEGKFIQANKAFAEALKTTKEKLLGKTVFDIYSAEIAQSMTKDDIIVMKSRRPKLGIVEPYESPTGLRWIRTDKIPSLDEKGNATGIVGFSEEITDHKNAEEALLESEFKYRQLVDKLPEMIFEIDSNGRVVFANSRAIEIIGYSKEELENGFDANRFVATEDVERSRENMKKMFAGGMRQSNEYVFVKKDGTHFPVLLTSAPVVKNTKIVGARGIVVDMTERKDMERQLKDKDRLAAIGATAGMVGHDIRNPLQAIIGEVYLLKDCLTAISIERTKEEVKEGLENIEKDLGYINKIVVDLQDYARPLKPDYKDIDLLDLLVSVLKKTDIPDQISLSIDVKGFLKLKTDPEFIRRALTNLVNNAIQAMPNGGKLQVTGYQKQDQACISVSDTGVGIPEEIKPKLFTPMTTTKSKGQGLGLAVVKRLVEALNGSICFESQEGKGTKFIVQLPSRQLGRE